MALTVAERRRRYAARHPERVREQDRRYASTPRGRATKAANNRRKVHVHKGPGGTVIMPTEELARAGREFTRKTKAAHAAGEHA